MGRWTQFDEDEHRLPDGMKRIGYDADEGRYYFRDGAGNVWRGGQGAQYGEMTRVNSVPATIHEEDENDEDEEEEEGTSSGRGRLDVEASPRGGYELLPTNTHHARSNANSPYRSLFPFFLIIAVVLLLIWRLILSPGLSTPVKRCPEGTSSYWIQPGESCWEVSRKHGWTLDKFKEVNPKVVCDPLMPGTSVCLPVEKTKAKAIANAQAQARTSMRKSSSLTSRRQ